MSKRRKVPLALAAVLLSETTACLCTRVPICDPVPPPPSQTIGVPTVGGTPSPALTVRPSATGTPTRTPTRTGTPPVICDPVPPPPYLTAQAATRTAQAASTRVPTPTGPPVICDPVPPPPFLTAQAATQTAQSGPRGAAPEAAPEIRAAASLPLAQRLALRVSPVVGQPNVFRVDTDFSAEEVWWTVSAGALEPCPDGVRWVPPVRGGTALLQAIVDAGPAGVAVDSLSVTAESSGNL